MRRSSDASLGAALQPIERVAGATRALRSSPQWFGSPRQSFSNQAQQVVSFAGDPARNDINQTKFEIEWRDITIPPPILFRADEVVE
jgi:hypothetical protein